MTALEIVGASHADCGALARMHAACFEEAWPEDSFSGFLDSPGAFILMGLRGETCVGFIVVRTAVDEAEILTVGVVPSSRHRGYATQLLLAAGTQAAQAGSARLFLEVAEGNTHALRLYRKFGFEMVGRRKGYYRDGSEDGLTMRSPLPLARLGNSEELD
ncbi:MAG: ribosomal protein S18-alanine N-acetyltransferase [Rhizomicrobium sp.]|jgi:ribosomal-protein-alanine N-acetyltransferase